MRLSLDDALVADELLRVHMSASPSPSMMMSSMHSGASSSVIFVVVVVVACRMELVDKTVQGSVTFVKDSYRLMNRCSKPDRNEFMKIALATTVGFLIMGFIGFFVKLIFIPINNIIIGT